MANRYKTPAVSADSTISCFHRRTYLPHKLCVKPKAELAQRMREKWPLRDVEKSVLEEAGGENRAPLTAAGACL